MWSNALRPMKIAHKSNACASSSWCLDQRRKLLPKKHVRKTLAFILSSEKAAATIQRDQEYRTHTTMYEAKKEKNEKSV